MCRCLQLCLYFYCPEFFCTIIIPHARRFLTTGLLMKLKTRWRLFLGGKGSSGKPAHHQPHISAPINPHQNVFP